MMVGFGIVIPVLPFLAHDLGASPVDMGLLVSVWALAQFLFAPLWGGFSDRWGRKPALVIGLMGLAVTQFMITLAGSVAGLVTARALGGLVSSATMPAASAYVADVTKVEDRGHAMALMGAAFASGFALGPAIGGVLAPFGVLVPFYAAGIMGLVAAVLTWAILPETRPRGAGPAAIGASAGRTRAGPFAVFSALKGPYGVFLGLAFANTFAGSSMFSMLSYFVMDRFAGSAADAGVAFTVQGVTSLIMQALVVGRVIRAVGESRTLQAGLLICVAGYLMVARSFAFPVLLGAVMLAAAGMAFAKPSIMSAVSKRTQMSQGVSMGMLSSSEALGRMVGPLWAGYLFSLSAGGPYYSAAAMMVVGLLALGMMMAQENRHGLRQQQEVDAASSQGLQPPANG